MSKQKVVVHWTFFLSHSIIFPFKCNDLINSNYATWSVPCQYDKTWRRSWLTNNDSLYSLRDVDKGCQHKINSPNNLLCEKFPLLTNSCHTKQFKQNVTHYLSALTQLVENINAGPFFSEWKSLLYSLLIEYSYIVRVLYSKNAKHLRVLPAFTRIQTPIQRHSLLSFSAYIDWPEKYYKLLKILLQWKREREMQNRK